MHLNFFQNVKVKYIKYREYKKIRNLVNLLIFTRKDYSYSMF